MTAIYLTVALAKELLVLSVLSFAGSLICAGQSAFRFADVLFIFSLASGGCGLLILLAVFISDLTIVIP